MEYPTLTNTGLVASKVCLGTMTFENGKGLFKAISFVGHAGADEVVRTSIDGGINSSDTAENYAEGESEKTVEQSLTTRNIAAQGCLDRNESPQRLAGDDDRLGLSRDQHCARPKPALRGEPVMMRTISTLCLKARTMN